jgi:hypothetical protein
MGFLDDLGLDNIDASTIDYSIANGVYPMVISASKIIPHSKKPGINQWQITYRVDSEVEDFGGKTVSEFFDLDPALPDNRKAWIKRRLYSLGYDDEGINSVDPGDLIGVEVTVTVVNKPAADGSRTYTNVKTVALGNDASQHAAFSPF